MITFRIYAPSQSFFFKVQTTNRKYKNGVKTNQKHGRHPDRQIAMTKTPFINVVLSCKYLLLGSVKEKQEGK